MRIFSLVYICVFAFATPLWAEETEHAVLVCATCDDVGIFTSKELRLMYLGFSVSKNNQRYEALINRTQETLYRNFLQKVMFMSNTNYQRKLVSRVFRHGGVRPQQFDMYKPLIEKLKSKANAVTFLMVNVELNIDDMKVIQKLW